ncbi:hypothetical protein [Methylobacterium sp. Leaf91]|uniref:Uncharacterized protein n=1 Tax=Methylobacterium bullatum TaxID=570505 RepID=A0A679IPP6_9HYPH|nr:hypothetical protein [Methylobacterium sp. Leaf91]CAA2100560.1 hypothetical protein MBUL_00733 [Methylobacterium bullatum]
MSLLQALLLWTFVLAPLALLLIHLLVTVALAYAARKYGLHERDFLRGGED